MSVYLIQAESGPVKIGTAGDPEGRLREFQTASFEPLTLKAAIPGGRALEQELHQMFRHFRMKGEWFQPDTEIFKAFYERDPVFQGWRRGHETGCSWGLEEAARLARIYAASLSPTSEGRLALDALVERLRALS